MADCNTRVAKIKTQLNLGNVQLVNRKKDSQGENRHLVMLEEFNRKVVGSVAGPL